MMADGLVQLGPAPPWSPGDVYRELAHGVAASTTPPGPSIARLSSGSEQARHCWLSGRRAARGPRRAFLATVRTVVDPGGQTINAADQLPVMAETPTMIVWGGRDPLIPVRHGRQAHRAIPSSRLEIFPKAGHFPHLEEPRRFAGLLVDFVEQTEDRLVQTAVPPATDRRVPALAAT
jgi:pimeloyl-ACP methyl ester carboxylesterase